MKLRSLTPHALLVGLTAVCGSPAAAAQKTEDWDILRVAESEARRATQALRSEIGKILTRMSAPILAEGTLQAGYARLLELGPDAGPVLVEALSTRTAAGESTAAAHAAHALVALYHATKNSAILDNLQRLVGEEVPEIQYAILRGLSQLDHPRSVAMAQPFLESERSSLARAAIQVLAAQTSATARGFLRPLLTKRPEDAALIIDALHRVDSGEDHEEVSKALLETESPKVVISATRYLAEHGQTEGLTALQRVLSCKDEWAKVLSDSQLQRCVYAIRNIGLRGTGGSNTKAKQILEELWKGLNPSKIVQSTARWELGPFRHEKAYESYESEFQAWSKAERTRNPKPWVDLADVQAQFQRYDDALKSLNRIAVMDPKGEYLRDRVEYKCRALCGKEQYGRAETALQEMKGADFSDLPRRYREVAKMAAMDKYAYLFEKN